MFCILVIELEGQCNRLEISLGLRQGLLSTAWTSLSGGERQRAAIGCALILATSMPLWTYHQSSSISSENKDANTSPESNVTGDNSQYQRQFLQVSLLFLQYFL